MRSARLRLLTLAAFLSITAHPGAVWASEIMLNCDGSYILLQPEDGRAILVDRDPVFVGSLEVEDHVYRIQFPQTHAATQGPAEIAKQILREREGGAAADASAAPATDRYWDTHIKVNRYSGAYEWEFEVPPVFEGNLDNIHRTGRCEQTGAEKKF